VLTAEGKRSIQQNYLRQPLSFEPNRGQTDKRVQFLSHGAGYSLFLTPADAVLSLQGPVKSKAGEGKPGVGKTKQGKTAALEMVTVGGNKLAPATGLEPAASHSNYFIGNDHSKWYEDVPNFARVKYQGIYPGIDLTYYGNQSRLEYDFVVSPGADPGRIKLQFLGLGKGMKSLHLDPKGRLLIDTTVGKVRFDRPILYQEKADGSRDAVEGSFAISRVISRDEARNEVHFKIGSYDKSRPLVIDPVIAFSTYLGGSGEENYFLGDQDTEGEYGNGVILGNWISGIAVDSTGSAYITGTTRSTNFPIGGTGGSDTNGAPVNQANYTFIAKFGPTGTLAYSTLLGGSSYFPFTGSAAVAGGIAVDGRGDAYITGYTTARNFPTSAGVYQPSSYPNNDAGIAGFVVKLNPSGTIFGNGAYSTYLYGSIVPFLSGAHLGDNVVGYTLPTAIAVDANGDAYVTGADCFGFPTTAGAFQATINANVAGKNVDISGGTVLLLKNAANAFVAELNPSGTALVYSTYLGGSINDVGRGIALNPNDNTIYVTGFTDSKDFPTAPAGNVIQATAAPGSVRQAFVARLNPAATGAAQLLYSTYLGGTGSTNSGVTTGDEGHAIAVDQLGNAYVTGSTESTDFPTNGTNPPLQSALNGGTGDTGAIDAFVTKLNSSGTPPLVFSTYLGGFFDDSGEGIALDADANFYVTGYTYSTPSNGAFGAFNFPTLPGFLPEDAVIRNNGAAFMTEYNTLATKYVQSTIFQSTSASGNIVGTGIAVDPSGNAYLTGQTRTFGMPTTPGAYQTALNGTSDAFLTKLWPLSITSSQGTDGFSPISLTFPDTLVNTSSQPLTVTLSYTGLTSLTLSNFTLGGANPGAFSLGGSTCSAGPLGVLVPCQIAVTFSPTAVGQNLASVNFTATDDQGMSQTITIPLSGNGAGLTVSPDPVTFTSTLVGATKQTFVSITNPGTSPVTVTNLSIQANGAAGPGFTFTGCTIPGTGLVLSANGGSCQVLVKFAPTSDFAFLSILTISDTIGGVSTQQSVAISGQGAGLLASPNPVTFQPTEVGQTLSTFVSLSNDSGSPLTITNLSITGPGFTFSRNTGCAIPATLSAGVGCQVKVTFAPTDTAGFAASLTATYTLGGNTESVQVPLSGPGVAPLATYNPASLTFPDTPVGTTSNVPVSTQIVNTGGAPLTIAGFSVPANSGFVVAPVGNGTSCAPGTVLAAQTGGFFGGSCIISLFFAPTTATGLTQSVLTVTDNSGGVAGASQLVPLSGQGIATLVTLNPASLTFNTMAGTTAEQDITVTNTTQVALNIAGFTLTGIGAQYFSITPSSTCGTMLAANGICTIGITYAPAAGTSGSSSATLSIADSFSGANAYSGTQTVPLTGNITPPGPLVVLNPSSLVYTATIGATSPAQIVTVSNTGTLPLNFTSIGITSLGVPSTNFALVDSVSACHAAPVPVGGSCTISITFTATSNTPVQAILSISDNAPGSPHVATLTGGVPAPQAVLTPATLAFPSTTVGTTSAAQIITLSNPGTATLNISTITFSGSGSFSESNNCGATLAAGANCTFSYTFTPTSTGPATATVSVADNATGSPQIATITGTGTALPPSTPLAVLSPATLAFPSTTVGATATAQTITLSNPGNATLNISGITVTGAKTAFAETTTCGATLAAGANCTFSVTFTPASAGSFAASISVADNAAGSPQTVALTGTGTAAVSAPQVVFTPATLAFSSTTVGATSAAQTITLSNSGNATLNIASGGITVTGTSPADFAETNTCGITLAAGANCTISVTFKPASAVSFAASISVADNASGSPQTVALTGIGTAAGGPASATFSVNAATLSQSVSSGAVAQFNIAVSSSGGAFNNAVTLSATGLPAGATVSFAPPAVTPGSAGSASVMSIQTQSLLAASAPVGDTHGHGSLPLLAALAGLPLLGMLRLQRRYRKATQRLMLLALAALSLLPFLALSGCGGGLFGATPHTSLITVTGTSGSLQQSTTVSLTVQ
jgi:hypothetical protein